MVKVFTKHIKNAIKIRAFEHHILNLFSQGKVRGTVHTSIGQELFPSLMYDFVSDYDYIFGNHRSHAHYLSYSNNYSQLLAEILGKTTGSSNGLGGSQHISFKNFYTNGIQGGMTGIASGSAFAQKMSKNNGISISILGDGTFGSGQIYESFNVSSKMNLPVLYIVENNNIAQSTPTENTLMGSIKSKFSAFDIQSKIINFEGMKIDSIYCDIQSIFDLIRFEKKPAAIIINSHRLGPHSKGDDNRGKNHVDALWKADFLSNVIMQDLEYNEYFQHCKSDFRILADQILAYGESKSVFVDFAEQNLTQINFDVELPNKNLKRKYVDMTYDALDLILQEHEACILIGEDIELRPKGTAGDYGGAFKVTRDLSDKYPNRVMNFPISEATLVGFGIGYALSGNSSICEIMFSDFLTLTVDQIVQQATKIPSMYGKFQPLSLLIRSPGGGRKGYGPTHSQNMEFLFLGLPNLVIYSTNIFSREGDYAELLKLSVPVLAIENKDLYTKNYLKADELVFDINILDNIRTIHLTLAGVKSYGLIITYGSATELVINCVQEIFQKFEILFEVLILQIINPIKISCYESILRHYERIIVVEETLEGGGITSNLVSCFSKSKIEKIFLNLGGVGNIGASFISEKEALISEEKITNFLLNLIKVK